MHYNVLSLLTYYPQVKMTHISQKTFSDAFPKMTGQLFILIESSLTFSRGYNRLTYILVTRTPVKDLSDMLNISVIEICLKIMY